MSKVNATHVMQYTSTEPFARGELVAIRIKAVRDLGNEMIKFRFEPSWEKIIPTRTLKLP